jgi:DNA-binding PadR family transcriptional regulator
MVYPALTYLEELGHAASSSEGSKKLYTLTPAGAMHLERHRQAADDAWRQLALVGRKLAHIQRQLAQDEDVAEHFGSDPQGRDRAEWQAMKAEFRGLRDDLKAAIHEKLDSSLQEKRRILEVLKTAIREIRGRP